MTDYPFPDANWSLIPPHMEHGLRDYVIHGLPPGGFLTAILSNDFMGAATRADEANLRSLQGWARFLYNYVPRDCKGSPEAVTQWIQHRGLSGVATMNGGEVA